MDNVTILATTSAKDGMQKVAVTYVEGRPTEFRVMVYGKYRNYWRKVKSYGKVADAAYRATRSVRVTFIQFYGTHEYEKPAPYTRLGLSFEACAAFPLS
jgi:hypothetical protein